jgi:hypothetical protein
LERPGLAASSVASSTKLLAVPEVPLITSFAPSVVLAT